MRLGSTQAQHRNRSERLTREIGVDYEGTMKQARAGLCSHALRLYGIANAGVGKLECERRGSGAGGLSDQEFLAADRDAWAAVVSCFTGAPAK